MVVAMQYRTANRRWQCRWLFEAAAIARRGGRQAARGVARATGSRSMTSLILSSLLYTYSSSSITATCQASRARWSAKGCTAPIAMKFKRRMDQVLTRRSKPMLGLPAIAFHVLLGIDTKTAIYQSSKRSCLLCRELEILKT